MVFGPVKGRVRTFIEEYPLYRKFSLQEAFEGMEKRLRVDAPAPEFSNVLPDAVHLDCPRCGRTQPFRDVHGLRRSPDLGAPSNRARSAKPVMPASGSSTPSEPPSERESARPVRQSGMFEVKKQCTFCQVSLYRCWIEVNASDGWIRKVGQVPRQSPAVPPELREPLGKDIELYRRARECLAESFGIAACSYLRRLLEDRVNPLLRLLLETKRSENAPQEELEDLEEALERTAFNEKAVSLYRRMPESMKSEGENPIKLLHRRLSEGVHSMDEDGAVAVATEGFGLFDYLLRELNKEYRRVEDRKVADENAKRLRAMGQ